MRAIRFFHSCINYIQIIFFLCTIVFKKYPDTKDLLRLIEKYLRLEAPFYKEQNIKMSRDNKGSINLLSSLVASYLETSSEVTLNQVLEVLKEEFIRRGNARK